MERLDVTVFYHENQYYKPFFTVLIWEFVNKTTFLVNPRMLPFAKPTGMIIIRLLDEMFVGVHKINFKSLLE